MIKAEEFKKLMGRWGFNTKIIKLSPWKQDFISNNMSQFLNSYVKEFPEKGNISIVGAPRLSQYIISNIIYQLYLNQKILSQVFYLDVPTYIVDQFYGGLIGDQQEQQVKIKEGLKNSDLVIFDEISLNPWTDNQQLRIYGLVNKRYQDKKPCIFTSSKNKDATEEALNDALYYRITDNCTYLDLMDVN